MSIHKSARFSAFPGRGDLARRAAPTFTLAARFIRLAARSQPASQLSTPTPGRNPEDPRASLHRESRFPFYLLAADQDLWPSNSGDAYTMPNSLAAIAATVKGYRGFKNKKEEFREKKS